MGSKSDEPEYRVTFPEPYKLQYQDDQLTLELSRERVTTGMSVVLHDLPTDTHISRAELARRIRRKVDKWGFKVTFLDHVGFQIEPRPECSVLFRVVDQDTRLEYRDGDGRITQFPMEFVIRPKYGIVVTMDDIELAHRVRTQLENRRFRVDFVDSAGRTIAPRAGR